MSITFTIDNNQRYIDTNCPEQIRHHSEPCFCSNYTDNEKADPDCRDCQGTGMYHFAPEYPWEMNVSNSNASTLLNSLGLTFDYCGKIDGRTLIAAIQRTPAFLIQRQTTESKGKMGCSIIDCGIQERQAEHYLIRLNAIAQEAIRREEKVVWGQ